MTRSGTPASERLDPDRDYLQIFRLTYDETFGWEVSRALELALFHTYAAPRISEILDRTGEFAERGQKRYDDTVALLREAARDDLAGRAAIRRLNWIHRAYDIPNDDLIYVLATFVVLPVRWIGRYGWRDLTETEVRASVNYYRKLGRRMGIRQLPETYSGFASFLDDYERENHAYTESNRRLAISLIRIFEAWFPRIARPVVRRCIAAALDERLRALLGLAEPCWPFRPSVHLALRLRATLIRIGALPVPAGKRRLRSYPQGYSLSDLGPAWLGKKGLRGAGPTGIALSCAEKPDPRR